MIDRTQMTRRQMLIGAGAATGGGLLLAAVASPAARAAAAVPSPVAGDWRRALADGFFANSSPMTVRGLQEGLEVWESTAFGYMVVDADQQLMLEGSPTARSPYQGVDGDLQYMGPGLYISSRGDEARSILSDERASAREQRALAREARAVIRESADRPTQAIDTDQSLLRALTTPTSSEIKSRVTSYGYITGSYVYKNTTGTCGWVAGSILTRYWHARSTSRLLLPSAYRSGTNMTSSPNFATYLQGSMDDSTWAPNVKDRLLWNLGRQCLAGSSSWAIGKIGAFEDVRNNRPVVMFGNIPKTTGGLAMHAVLAYGETNSGYLIAHYGYSGYTSIVVNGGLFGSNTKFRLG